jgi:hypothetical protein
MNKELSVLNSSNSTVADKREALIKLENYRINVGKKVQELESNPCPECTITTENVLDVMLSIQEQLNNVNFNNIDEIETLYSLKFMIEQCNKIVEETKPIIKYQDDDITDMITEKMVIGSTINKKQTYTINWKNIHTAFCDGDLRSVIDYKWGNKRAKRAIPTIPEPEDKPTDKKKDGGKLLSYKDDNLRYRAYIDKSKTLLYAVFDYNSNFFVYTPDYYISNDYDCVEGHGQQLLGVKPDNLISLVNNMINNL